MRYTKFGIANFKGIQKLELNLDDHPKGPIITLVGLNESGKTTILEALDYLQLGIADSDPYNLLGFERDDPHDLMPIAKRSNFNETTSISVEVELNIHDRRMLQHYLTEHGFAPSSVPTRLTITDNYSFSDSVFQGRQAIWDFDPVGKFAKGRVERSLYYNKQVWDETVDFLREQMPSIWYFPNFLFDFPRRIYLDKRAGEEPKQQFYRNLMTSILESVNPNATLERHIAGRISSSSESDKTALNQLLLELGRKITHDVFESWNEIFQRPPSMKAALKADSDSESNRYIELSIEDYDGFYYIDERSLGFRWFFVFLLITKYTRVTHGISRNIVYLFDEPASNLHAGAQSQLLKSLEPLSNECTIIYTTHSHHLINPEWLENTYVVRNKGFDFDTSITSYKASQTDITIERYRSFARQHPRQTRYFQPILDVLDYQPFRLELVPNIIIVEGKNDFYTLTYMKSRFGSVHADEINLVPGNGASGSDSIIRLYLGWAQNFIILLDSDKAGEQQKKRYIAEFGPIVEERIYSLGDLRQDMEGNSLEEAFEQSDKDSVIDAVDPGQAYDKVLFNRAIQECLVLKKMPPISSDSVTRFIDILDQLHDLLYPD